MVVELATGDSGLFCGIIFSMKSAFECKYLNKCGGCDYSNITYEEYLNKKKSFAIKTLQGIAKVSTITGMEIPYHYRNKVHAALGIKDRKIVCGTYKKNSHTIIEHDDCLIEDEECDKIIQSIKRLLKDFKIKVYDEDTDFGLVRHILIRKGVKTGQILVVLVCTDIVFPSKNNFIKELLKLHKNITSVILNVNDRYTSQILGQKNVVLFGKGYIDDIIFENKYRISANSFYQVNPYMVEKLYCTAIDKARLKVDSIVLDLYCGIGTIGMSVAKYAKQVIGVEINKEAVKDAIINVKQNGIKNVRIINQDAKDFMSYVVEEERKSKVKTIVDTVFIDPPREGCDREFIISLMSLSPNKIVYISCNPETLARDLRVFNRCYDIGNVDLFDMFPWTSHVECVVLMSRIDS